MEIEKTILEGVLIFSPKIYRDNRGFFLKVGIQRFFIKKLIVNFLLYKIIILFQNLTFLEGCTIKLKNRKEN